MDVQALVVPVVARVMHVDVCIHPSAVHPGPQPRVRAYGRVIQGSPALPPRQQLKRYVWCHLDLSIGDTKDPTSVSSIKAQALEDRCLAAPRHLFLNAIAASLSYQNAERALDSLPRRAGRVPIPVPESDLRRP